jgi:hypothetical protein
MRKKMKDWRIGLFWIITKYVSVAAELYGQ